MGARYIPNRVPRYNLGDYLTTQNGFTGQVDAIFADYQAAVACGVVGEDWLERQSLPPATKDQVFYGLVGDGAVLAGECSVRPA